MGTNPANVSLYHFIKSGATDRRVPLITVKLFVEKMKAAGNRRELVAFENMPHAFALYGRNENKPYAETLFKADEFLASLGYPRGKPTIQIK